MTIQTESVPLYRSKFFAATQASYDKGYALCAYRASEEALRKEVYEEGVELERAPVARTIFERLVKEGRAEVVAEVRELWGGKTVPWLPKNRRSKIANG